MTKDEADRHHVYFGRDEDPLDKAKQRYFKSKKGRKAQRRYHQSEAGKTASRRYFSSEKGKMVQLRYALSPKGQLVQECKRRDRTLARALSRYLKEHPGKTVEDFLKEVRNA